MCVGKTFASNYPKLELRAPCLFNIFFLYFLYIFLNILCSFCIFVFLPFCLFAFLPFLPFAFLSFCLFALLQFSLFDLLSYCLFVFLHYLHFCLLLFCLFVFVHIYYHTNFCSNPTIFQFYQKFYLKPLPLLPPIPPTTFSVPRRNTGKCFERPAKILRGRQIFGDNLAAVGAGGAGVLTIWF